MLKNSFSPSLCIECMTSPPADTFFNTRTVTLPNPLYMCSWIKILFVDTHTHTHTLATGCKTSTPPLVLMAFRLCSDCTQIKRIYQLEARLQTDCTLEWGGSDTVLLSWHRAACINQRKRRWAEQRRWTERRARSGWEKGKKASEGHEVETSPGNGSQSGTTKGQKSFFLLQWVSASEPCVRVTSVHVL